MNKYNILTERQQGFRTNGSNETGYIDLIQHISRNLDKMELVCLSFDLTRTFDTVDTIFVSCKLFHLGLRANINSFIVTFLSNRKFAVKVDTSLSGTFDQTGKHLGTHYGKSFSICR